MRPELSCTKKIVSASASWRGVPHEKPEGKEGPKRAEVMDEVGGLIRVDRLYASGFERVPALSS
jgi:hypothetical protein